MSRTVLPSLHGFDSARQSDARRAPLLIWRSEGRLTPQPLDGRPATAAQCLCVSINLEANKECPLLCAAGQQVVCCSYLSAAPHVAFLTAVSPCLSCFLSCSLVTVPTERCLYCNRVIGIARLAFRTKSPFLKHSQPPPRLAPRQSADRCPGSWVELETHRANNLCTSLSSSADALTYARSLTGWSSAEHRALYHRRNQRPPTHCRPPHRHVVYFSGLSQEQREGVTRNLTV